MSGDRRAKISHAFLQLIGLKLQRCSNILGTRLFHFYSADSLAEDTDEVCTLVVECPWRIEHLDTIVVGSEDYGQALDNLDPGLTSTSKPDDLQDQRLVEMLGAPPNGGALDEGRGLSVTAIDADAFGGFRVGFADDYFLAVFPASGREMEWMLRWRVRGYIALMNGAVAESEREHRRRPPANPSD